jgi:hypothetical protein
MTPPSNIAIATLADLEFVSQRMRDDEIEQALAFSGAELFDPGMHALRLANFGPIRYTLVDGDGYPAVVAGWYQVTPGVWQCWMMGTAKAWTDHWQSITKGCRWLMEELEKLPGTKRLQLNALASRTEAIEWYERGLLMQPCGVVQNYGANGEAVAFFSREVKRG